MKSTKRPVQAVFPTTHTQEINGAEFVFEVLPLAQAVHVHVPCVFVACSYVPRKKELVLVDHYLSHTTHLARTLADPQLLACLATHGVTHIRLWREPLATRRKEMTLGMPQCKGACNQQLLRPSR